MSGDGAQAPRIKPAKAKNGSGVGEFYRQSRLWHAYLSAFAFLALMFFSVTGVLLNHPDWFAQPRPAAQDFELILPRAEIDAAMASADPAAALAAAAQAQADLKGVYDSGEVIDREAMIRLNGATGMTDLVIDLESGRAEATIQSADAVTILHELHRGTNAGEAWRLLIDITGFLVLGLSIIGYVLFFSLRFRLRTSLLLTFASLAAMGAVFYFLVP